MCVESVRAEKKLFIAYEYGAQYQSKKGFDEFI